MSRKRTDPDRAHKAAAIARMVLVDGKTQKEAAEAFHTNASGITRILAMAREEGIVRCEIDEDVLSWDTDEELESKLRQKFNLKRAIVLRREEVKGGEATDEEKEKDSDRLHRLLGKFQAHYLQDIVLPNAHIATVGGRGTFFVSHFCSLEPIIGVDGVHVSAISGRMATQLHGGGYLVPSVDADDAAYLLARAFCSDFLAYYHPLHKPVAYESPKTAQDRVSEFPELFDKNNPQKILATIGLCGVGVLEPHHMFRRYDTQHSDYLAPIRDQVKELESLFGNSSLATLPIGDVANRLFLIDDIEDQPLKEKVLNKLAQINKNIVGLTFTQLANIPLIILNAGGLHKYQAIKKVMGWRKPNGRPFVNVLCIDASVAEKLLEEDQLENTNVKDLPGEE